MTAEHLHRLAAAGTAATMIVAVPGLPASGGRRLNTTAEHLHRLAAAGTAAIIVRRRMRRRLNDAAVTPPSYKLPERGRGPWLFLASAPPEHVEYTGTCTPQRSCAAGQETRRAARGGGAYHILSG
jgi:hypothetical protein